MRFPHGLGDCANFAHLLKLMQSKGLNVGLCCDEDKNFVFSGLALEEPDCSHAEVHFLPYFEPRDPCPEIADQYWLYNKTGTNMLVSPFPPCEDPAKLWDELCDVRLQLAPHVPEEDYRAVDEFLAQLPKPIVLIHPMGNTGAEFKNIPPDKVIQLCKEVLQRMSGTIILLDWDNRVPRLPTWRVRHLVDDWLRPNVSQLVALMDRSDLLISIDSGPLHLARMLDIPVIGLFPTLTKHPARVALPNSRAVNIVPKGVAPECNRQTRIRYNIVESPSSEPFDLRYIAIVAAKMLSGPRYLGQEMIGADMQLQQFVLEWERGSLDASQTYNDRNAGFDILFREIVTRFASPSIVETGCIRHPEDWKGAGYSTYLLGAMMDRLGGSLISVDNDGEHCGFARNATKELKSVTVVEMDSVAYLRRRTEPIDVLVLDSMDTWMDETPKNVLREVQASLACLHSRSIIVIDDTTYFAKDFQGNGRLAVPWLLSHGWRILHSGYQTLLVRKEG
ncbi:MAG: class I SAM-dependent methyltransferase [Armatimonadetes bacterium]|nr:class I SAM-dependent methyltransferase [Armatimonadota bacterium]